MDNNTVDLDILVTDYASRKLDICGVCRQRYNVGDRIPRILVNCGHTYCTSCLTKYYRKARIRCPFCKKLVKNLESVEQLPLNIMIFADIVAHDQHLLGLIDLDGPDAFTNLCEVHNEKQKHFYCSHHETNFCRECIKVYHRDDECCVVDLVDISKLFQLNEQNVYKNYMIVKARNRSEKNNRTKDEFFIANS